MGTLSHTTEPAHAVKLLRGTLHERVQWEGLVPKNWQLKHMNSLAAEYGIGVADIGTEVAAPPSRPAPSMS